MIIQIPFNFSHPITEILSSLYIPSAWAQGTYCAKPSTCNTYLQIWKVNPVKVGFKSLTLEPWV